MATVENVSAEDLRQIMAEIEVTHSSVPPRTTQRGVLSAPRPAIDIRGRAVLDNASYFTANKVKEFVEETPIELCYPPRGQLR